MSPLSVRLSHASEAHLTLEFTYTVAIAFKTSGLDCALGDGDRNEWDDRGIFGLNTFGTRKFCPRKERAKETSGAMPSLMHGRDSPMSEGRQ